MAEMKQKYDKFNGLDKTYGAILESLDKTLLAIRHRLETDRFYYSTSAKDMSDQDAVAKEMLGRVNKAIDVLRGDA